MFHIIEENNINKIYLSGDLNRDNILPVKEDILKSIRPKTKEVEFHFEDVNKIDAPAMAMIVIVIKSLVNKKITSKIKELTGENKDLAAVLGLHLIAEIESEPQIPKIS